MNFSSLQKMRLKVLLLYFECSIWWFTRPLGEFRVYHQSGLVLTDEFRSSRTSLADSFPCFVWVHCEMVECCCVLRFSPTADSFYWSN